MGDSSKRKEIETITGEPLPPELPTEAMDQLVAEINAFARAKALETALGVGRLIVDDIYGGDLEAWRDRGRKDASFRKLASRGDCDLSASGLYRSVAVYELCERLGASRWKHLGASHLYAVLALEHGAQRRLLDRAESERWTVRKLKARAGRAKKRARGGGKLGRPRKLRFVRTIDQLERMLRPEVDAFGQLERLGDLERKKREKLLRTVTSMKLRCEELERQLGRGVGGSAAGGEE